MTIIHLGMRTICAVIKHAEGIIDDIDFDKQSILEDLSVIQSMAKNMENSLVRKNETIEQLNKEIIRLEKIILDSK